MAFLLVALAMLVVELYVFVQVSVAVGFLPALALAVVVSLLGLWLVKVQGLGVLRRLSAERDTPPTRELADGAMVLGAAFLLLFPGFVTGFAGLLLLLPPVRALLRPLVVRRWNGAVQVVRIGHRHEVVDTTATDATTRGELDR